MLYSMHADGVLDELQIQRWHFELFHILLKVINEN